MENKIDWNSLTQTPKEEKVVVSEKEKIGKKLKIKENKVRDTFTLDSEVIEKINNIGNEYGLKKSTLINLLFKNISIEEVESILEK